MANRITAKAIGEDAWVRLSNGGTSVLLSTLMLAASDLAETPWEIGFAQFLADRDQRVFGLGTVGFDVGDLAWNRVDFAAQKDFVLRVVDLATRRHRWEVLSYDPPFAIGSLKQLHGLLQRWEVRYLGEDTRRDLQIATQQPIKCEKHGVYENIAGCPICHGEPLE